MLVDSKEKLLLCADAIRVKKAFKLAILEIKGLSSIADYFVICSGKSDRQVQAIASAIEVTLKKEGIYPLGVEGFSEAKWVLLDYDDVVVHVFYEGVREFYDLEGLWSDAPNVEV